jgi:hypothetical protein
MTENLFRIVLDLPFLFELKGRKFRVQKTTGGTFRWKILPLSSPIGKNSSAFRTPGAAFYTHIAWL